VQAAGRAGCGWVAWSADCNGPVDRYGVAEQVEYRAVLVDRRGKLLVALGGLWPGDADPHPDRRETGPDAVVEPEEAADVEIPLHRDGELVEMPRCSAQKR